MESASRRRVGVGAGVAGVLLMAGLLLHLIREAESVPRGPVDVVWDHERCTHCRMLISEPGFAAQLHERSGDVLYFDDPGCLMLYEELLKPDVHARYFHHLREDRWIDGDRVGFVNLDASPMGYGIGAVDAGTPGALDAATAATQVQLRESRRRRD